MERRIVIENTKGVKHLSFPFPDKTGVYLLVGSNGVGKTTLLICMDRICNSYAFARGFAQPKNFPGYDEYNQASIQYDIDNTSIRFKKGPAKWVPSPRKGSATLLAKFGFSETVFIRADSKRIDATKDDLQKGSIQSADSTLTDTMNTIFETTKYNNLKKLKVTHGRGRQSSYFNVIKDGRNYYTEKRFSTGEIAVLRLIESISEIPEDSLLLLDEAEMALHPRVQVNLLEYLKACAVEKNLTVFVSTHSPTLIKTASPHNTLLLEPNTEGNTEVITPCYPARALGSIDYVEAKVFDYVLFVEDEMARYFLKHLIKRYRTLNPEHATAYVSIVPVGGFYQTSQMAVATNDQLFGQSKVFALVDADAFEDLDTKPEFSKLYKDKNNKKVIHSLGITPEVFFIDKLVECSTSISASFRKRMNCEIKSILSCNDYKKCTSQKDRKLAKNQFQVFISQCCNHTGDCEEIIKNDLIKLVVEDMPESKIKSILGPIFY